MGDAGDRPVDDEKFEKCWDEDANPDPARRDLPGEETR